MADLTRRRFLTGVAATAFAAVGIPTALNAGTQVEFQAKDPALAAWLVANKDKVYAAIRGNTGKPYDLDKNVIKRNLQNMDVNGYPLWKYLEGGRRGIKVGNDGKRNLCNPTKPGQVVLSVKALTLSKYTDDYRGRIKAVDARGNAITSYFGTPQTVEETQPGCAPSLLYK